MNITRKYERTQARMRGELGYSKGRNPNTKLVPAELKGGSQAAKNRRKRAAKFAKRNNQSSTKKHVLQRGQSK